MGRGELNSSGVWSGFAVHRSSPNPTLTLRFLLDLSSIDFGQNCVNCCVCDAMILFPLRYFCAFSFTGVAALI